MGKINIIVIRDLIFKKYIKRSWVFIGIAILLSLKAVSQLANFKIAFTDIADKIPPGSLDIFIFSVLTVLASLLFYQLDNLLSIRHVKSNS
jgi:hypothetical protein